MLKIDAARGSGRRPQLLELSATAVAARRAASMAAGELLAHTV